MSEQIVLRGHISDYRAERRHADFFFSRADRNAIGIAAIGAAIVGAGGAAIGTAISASSTEEDADHVQFMLDGRRLTGWIWRSPFADGDHVEAVCECAADTCSVIAMARPADRIIAMYPHLTRGRWAHLSNAFKWWLGLAAVSSVVMFLFFYAIWASQYTVGRKDFEHISLAIGIVNLLLLPPFIHTAWKSLKFARAAEQVFTQLGWRNVTSLDLKKTSKAGATGNEPPEYGVYYFKY